MFALSPANRANGPVAAFEWIRCNPCGNGLWRNYGSHVEATFRLRSGEHRSIRVQPEQLDGVATVCEKCGAEWTYKARGYPDMTTPEAKELVRHMGRHLLAGERR